MKTESPFELPTYEVMGHKLRIHFNHTLVVREDTDGGSETFHTYDTSVVEVTASRDTVIESIMRVKYPTYGVELAAVQNGKGVSLRHGEYRDMAKQLADDWFGTGTHEDTLRRKRRRLKVTRFQAKVALLHYELLDTIEAFIAQSTDPMVKLAWQEAGFERLSPFISQVQESLGLSDEQLDDMFDYAIWVM